MAYLPKRRPFNKPPTFLDVALNITFKCNLACVGCDRASFIKPEHSSPMTVERLGSFFEEVRSAGITLKRMRIVGGEPTLHPDFLEMVKMCMQYSNSVKPRCNVRIFSNRNTQETRNLLEIVRKRHGRCQLLGGHKKASRTFQKMTRYEYVSPLDSGTPCDLPCPNMGGRGKCGSGVDQVGYSLCPTAGPICAILGLDARAKTVKQMIDPEFIRWQQKTICSHCGNFMAYKKKDLPKLWYCNGTPVSEEYHKALVEAGFMARESDECACHVGLQKVPAPEDSKIVPGGGGSVGV